jgi:hypothetical protein
MTELHRNPNGPLIDTNSTRQLRRHVERLCRRHPPFLAAIDAIRAGDGHPLLDLARRAQAGDDDATLVAIAALLPSLCKVVLSRFPSGAWSAAIDDYLSIVFIVIRDLPDHDGPAFLADKIIARTRRRHERQVYAHQPVPAPDDFLIRHGPHADDTEHTALVRMRLAAVVNAVRSEAVSTEEWQRILVASFGDAPEAPVPDRERRAVFRARRRLDRASVRPLAA